MRQTVHLLKYRADVCQDASKDLLYATRAAVTPGPTPNSAESNLNSAGQNPNRVESNPRSRYARARASATHTVYRTLRWHALRPT